MHSRCSFLSGDTVLTNLSLKKNASLNHLRAFQRDIPLLFQFIYVEFLYAQRELLSLLNLIQLAKEKVSLEVAALALTKLTGPLTEHFQWHSQDGVLTKLKNNCSYMIQSSTELHTYADKAWMLVYKCLEGIHEFATVEEPLLSEAVDNLFALGDVLKGLIPHFKEDENVIFFIIRHREALDSLYPKPFLRNCFEKIYPDGLRSVSKFLIERYTERGFGHLIPTIEKLCQN